MKYYEIASKTKDEIFKFLKSGENGLKKEEVKRRIEKNGKNVATDVKPKSALYFIIDSFKDKFILILLVLAVIDLLTKDFLGTFIIVLMAIGSAFLSFIQNYSAYRFNENLKKRVRPKTTVIRNGKEEEIYQEDIVIGDIVTLSAGSVIPADMVLIEGKDLFVNESVFTGESVPIEKSFKQHEITEDEKNSTKEDVLSIKNIGLMGTSVVSRKW